jgi:hypothetical protein
MFMDRRKFILAAGAGTVAAIAGCSDSGGNGADTSSPGAVVESFYNIGDGFDQDSSADEIIGAIDPILHSASPYPDIISESEDESEGTQTNTLVSVETETSQENLDTGELEEFGLGFFDVSEEAIGTIAEENAVVDTTVEYEEASTNETQHLTATEDGDWLLVV